MSRLSKILFPLLFLGAIGETPQIIVRQKARTSEEQIGKKKPNDSKRKKRRDKAKKAKI